ncbi:MULTISPECIES: threonine/serine exporter family protein [unclassified Sporolactobacillus]|uniref:threonine/serine exporter family protein n=1 Tax=unclassified Sporolactobacillus TaxID=2628533 RepID=UPI002368745D|nr:threonine/serine exporter family protein [Sporolactobacillus sp. CQH2019]MDD9148530.1 threonine/serine exporter family protein [Sporolactobacillus sp. CQH2019]
MNLISILIVQSVTSFLATAAFGIIYNISWKPLIHGGLIGMAGWLIYFFLYKWSGNAFAATFAASFAIALLSQIFARRYKNPVIVYSVSGIIPLVPGGLTYTVMSQAVVDQYSLALHLAEKTFVLSGAIAMGLIFAEVLYQIFKKGISPAMNRLPRNFPH